MFVPGSGASSSGSRCCHSNVNPAERAIRYGSVAIARTASNAATTDVSNCDSTACASLETSDSIHALRHGTADRKSLRCGRQQDCDDP